MRSFRSAIARRDATRGRDGERRGFVAAGFLGTLEHDGHRTKWAMMHGNRGFEFQKENITISENVNAARYRPALRVKRNKPFSAVLRLVILAARQPGSHTVSCGSVYQMLRVRGFRAHAISRRGSNLFKPLRRHFAATPFCRHARGDPGDRLGSKDRRSARRSSPGTAVQEQI